MIVPALNEAAALAGCLDSARAEADELIVADGGSDDDTAAIAAQAGAQFVAASSRGRASLMNAGASCASGDVLLFLHPDCRLQPGWAQAVRRAVDERGRLWGCFVIRLDSVNPLLWGVAAATNLSTRLTGVCSGTQAIFLDRSLWVKSNGFARVALMEDVELSRRLKRIGRRPARLRPRVRVSASRWRQHGVLRTVAASGWLRLLCLLGASPQGLSGRRYDRARR
ncbi:MAG: TIGR04283 family arsenosugar biosynthesis glycosyltransferase [Burkholderiaceae bacterium]